MLKYKKMKKMFKILRDLGQKWLRQIDEIMGKNKFILAQ